jgi:hypothetical protein
MASATFMVISSQFVYWQHYKKEDLIDGGHVVHRRIRRLGGRPFSRATPS